MKILVVKLHLKLSCNFISSTYSCLAWAYVDSRNWQLYLVWAVAACSLCSWSSACKAPQCENKVQQGKHRFLRYAQVHERKQNQEMRWDKIQFLKQINRHHCTWKMVKGLCISASRQADVCTLGRFRVALHFICFPHPGWGALPVHIDQTRGSLHPLCRAEAMKTSQFTQFTLSTTNISISLVSPILVIHYILSFSLCGFTKMLSEQLIP